VDYKIPIPSNHPSGLFWFHPHVHGIALNQVSQGMADDITIGRVGDNVRGDVSNSPWPDSQVRHLLLKDIMVMAAGQINFGTGMDPRSVADGEVLNQRDSAFCTQFPALNEVRRGSCPGTDNTGNGGNNYTGGSWYLTVSGQQFPTINVTEPDGEIWRLTNASGSMSYDLHLVDDANQNPMVVQLIAIDGVAVHLPQDTPMNSVVHMTGGRFKVVPCPAASAIGSVIPVCVNELVMMPSSRAELWVTYRNPNGFIVGPPAGASATLKMVGLTMGTGDAWPAVDLAKVLFKQSGPRQFTTAQVVVNGNTDSLSVMKPGGIFNTAAQGVTAAPLPAGCAALAPGHRRRIFFGFDDVTINNTFALGYEELDQNGNVVAGSQIPAPDKLLRFDPSVVTVCLPLGPGQRPVTEKWELVQLSTENHNFHLHQTRFAMEGTNGGVLQDNFPLGVAVPDMTISDQIFNPMNPNFQNGVCTITQWRSGHCASPPHVMDIPFTKLGDFVYHCHILEHEDGGMMARINVVPSPN
jgi:L-ascorbate oxidase